MKNSIKKSILTTLITMAIFTGCQDKDKELSSEKNEAVISPYIHSYNLEIWESSKSLNTDSDETIISENGVTTTIGKIYQPENYKIRETCKVKLLESQVRNDSSASDKFWGMSPDYTITAQLQKDAIKNCIKKYYDTHNIDMDSLSYLIEDQRIKDNLKHDFLKKALEQALNDNEVTYSEVINIYENLDKAILENQKLAVENFLENQKLAVKNFKKGE